MSFGNMTIELNAFNVDNQQEDEDEEVHEINMINSIVEDVSLSIPYPNHLEEDAAYSLDKNVDVMGDIVAPFESVLAYNVSQKRDVETTLGCTEKSIHISAPLGIMHTDPYQPWDDPYLQNQCPGKSEWRHIFSDKYDDVSPYTCGKNTNEPIEILFWNLQWLIWITHTHVYCNAGYWMTLLQNLLILLMILLDFMLLDELMELIS